MEEAVGSYDQGCRVCMSLPHKKGPAIAGLP